jgi:lipid-A-disaccharide synthase
MTKQVTRVPLAARDLDIFLIAVEPSADVLGAKFMDALRSSHKGGVSFRGLGGPEMIARGLSSCGDIADIAAIGVVSLIPKLPLILRRLRETVDAIVAQPPDLLVLIDAPDFTHRVAARVRRRLPHVLIVKYVSPTVWVWRSGRARAMRRFIDLVLALFPFEPEVHRQLGGPPCVYVGHPLLDGCSELQPSPDEAEMRDRQKPLVLALPGSRMSELRTLTRVFGETLALVSARYGPIEVIVPTLPHLVSELHDLTADWPIGPRIIADESEKHAAFRRARAALAASGTVTLELALAGVPTVAAYRIPLIEGAILRAIVRIHPAVGVKSVILANLVLGDCVIPEFVQSRCTAANLAPALFGILHDTMSRRRQMEAFERLPTILQTAGATPSARAAAAVLDLMSKRAGDAQLRPL